MSSNAIDSRESVASSTELNSVQLNSEKAPSASSPASSNASALPENKGKNTIDKLIKALNGNRFKKQLSAVHELAAIGENGELALADFVRSLMAPDNLDRPTAVHGSAYQYLYQGTSKAAKAFIKEFPKGLVCPQSSQGVDYDELQMLLITKEYQLADKLTNQKLCELAGESAIARKWVYFTEVEKFPALDLTAIDIIWGLYSEDKFGWSKQYELWTRLGRDWERMWPQLSWKNDGAWTRYPNEFIWDLSAPIGHLPLSNQLRGVRTMSAILSHPAWGE